MLRTILLPLLVVPFGCIRKESVSTPKHLAANPTRSTNPVQWVAPIQPVVENELVNVGRMEDASPNFVPPADHVVNRRLQVWVDRIDTYLRQKFPKETASTPKPVLRVVGTYTSNAFVAGFDRCIKVPVLTANATGPSHTMLTMTATGRSLFSDSPLGNLGSYLCAQGAFVEAAPDELAQIVTFMNTIAPSGCTYRFESGKITLTKGCFATGEENEGTASAITFPSTGNIIHITSGMIGVAKTEEELISIIAHEMGHYFRSHINATQRYFYRIGNEAHNEKPAPEPSLENLREDLIRMGEVRAFPTIHDTRYPVPMAGGIINVARDESTKITDACRSLQTLSTQLIGRNKPLDFFPNTALPKGGEQFYLQLEAAFDACAKTLRLVDQTVTDLADNVFLSRISSPYLDKSRASELLKQLTTKPDSTLFSYAQSLIGLVQERERYWNELVAKVIRERIGMYTNEQEADEIMLEWMDETKTNIRAGINVWMSFEGESDRHSIDSVGANTCRDLIARDFLDANGKEVFVQPGLWADDHHSFCYRSFNLAREIRGHKYTNQFAPLPAGLPGGDFASIQKLAAEISASTTTRNNGQASDAMARAIPNRYGGCPYAPKR